MNVLTRIAALCLFAACFLVAGTGLASAQAIPAAIGSGPYIAVGGGFSAFHTDYGERTLGGALVWSDLHFHARSGIEAEARFLRFHTDEDVTQSTYLVGPHIYLFRHERIKPYVKGLVGVGHMQFPYKYAEGSYFVASGGAGVDFRLNSVVAVRVVDLEYQSWPQFTYGSLRPYGVSAGISFRLTRLSDTPHGGRHH